VFGAADRANLVGYSQEQEWKKEGSITKVVLYVDEQYGCVQGIKAVYGATASPLIGINKRGNKPIRGKDLKLEDGEVVMGLEYRAGRQVLLQAQAVTENHLKAANARSMQHQLRECPWEFINNYLLGLLSRNYSPSFLQP
jgi:hypothetical protein